MGAASLVWFGLDSELPMGFWGSSGDQCLRMLWYPAHRVSKSWRIPDFRNQTERRRPKCVKEFGEKSQDRGGTGMNMVFLYRIGETICSAQPGVFLFVCGFGFCFRVLWFNFGASYDVFAVQSLAVVQGHVQSGGQLSHPTGTFRPRLNKAMLCLAVSTLRP